MLVKVISKIKSDSNNAVDMQLKRYLTIATRPEMQELAIKLHKELEEDIKNGKYDPMQMIPEKANISGTIDMLEVDEKGKPVTEHNYEKGKWYHIISRRI